MELSVCDVAMRLPNQEKDLFRITRLHFSSGSRTLLLGIVFQNLNFIEHLTVMENLSLAFLKRIDAHLLVGWCPQRLWVVAKPKGLVRHLQTKDIPGIKLFVTVEIWKQANGIAISGGWKAFDQKGNNGVVDGLAAACHDLVAIVGKALGAGKDGIADLGSWLIRVLIGLFPLGHHEGNKVDFCCSSCTNRSNNHRRPVDSMRTTTRCCRSCSSPKQRCNDKRVLQTFHRPFSCNF